MSELQTPSDLMVERQIHPQQPECVLPHQDVQKFLLDLIEQANFQGRMVEFVSGVKNVIKSAQIKGL